MHKLVSSALSSSGLKSAAITTIGNISATGVAAIAMIIFSRVLGPQQFGVFSVLFSVMLIVSRIGDMGINIAVSRAIAQNSKQLSLATSYSQTGSFLKLAIMLLVVGVGVIFARPITTAWLNLDASYTTLFVVVLTLSITIVIYEYVGTLLQARHAFATSVLTNVIQSSLKLLVALGSFFVTSLTLSFITTSYLIAPLIGAGVGLFVISLRDLYPIYNPTIARKIISVARWTSVAILASTLAENVDVIIVQQYLTAYDTGIYAAATRIATVASLVGWSLGTVLNMRVAKYKDQKNLNKYLKKAATLSVAALLLTLAVILITTPLVTLTLGVEYLASIPVLNVLLLSTALLTATSPFVALFYAFDYPRYFAISGILTAVILIAADLLLIPMFGLNGAALARVIMRIIVLLYTLSAASRQYQKAYAKN